MTEKAAQRLLSGRAWDDWCETLRQTGHMIEQFGDGVTDLDRTEWYRFLSRYVRMGFEHYVECSEPTRPRFHAMTWRQSINFTSPLQDHFFADFEHGGADYVITGNKGTMPYFVIASLAFDGPADFAEQDWAPQGVEGLKLFNTALLKTQGAIESGSISFDAEGNFRVVVSNAKPADGSDWLRTTPDTTMLLCRAVYEHREGVTPATMTIARADNAPHMPIDAAFLSGALAKAGQMTRAYAELARSWWQDNLSGRPNTVRFDEALYMSNGGVQDDRFHGFGAWECGADEALVVRFTPIDCDFWTFQLCNIWQENFDNYEEGQGYVFKDGARIEADGTVTMVIAHTDPGLDGGTWIDPYGHTHGGWSFRLIKTRGKLPPPVYSWKLQLAQLQAGGLGVLDGLEPLISGGVI
ncbi:hypothetical protein [Novosphingobium lentum]|uniref:hypothetical protein n=1 Tax=Novosphingobium lentum TaxID=145287 RepID=UPI0008341255|nr:hypothetical protein [Novosphingobium lentum]